MRVYYEDLKSSMESVRGRNLESKKFNQSQLEERQADDLRKLDFLIKQLGDRWENSNALYKNRFILNACYLLRFFISI